MMVIVKDRVPMPLAFEAESVAMVLMTDVGVPEMRPLEVLTESPGGRAVAPKVVGLLVAVIWYVNAVPTTPVAEVALLMAGAVGGVAVTVNVALLELTGPTLLLTTHI